MTISFGAFVGLMVAGSDTPDAICGRRREIEQDGSERITRVWRRAGLVRVEDEHGAVEYIKGSRGEWWRDGDSIVHREFAPNPFHRHREIGFGVGADRPSWERWDGNDFTRPTGPVTDVQFLGRPAYLVELAPPEHKPHPLQLTIDAATGLVLRKANAAFGTSEEWIEVDIGCDLADTLFVWEGSATAVLSHEEVFAQREAEHEADMTERRRWLAAHGISDIALPIETEIVLHDWNDETGEIYASLNSRSNGTLLRRRKAGSVEWPEVGTINYEHVHRWSDEHWDWCLGVDAALTDEWLASLRERLAAST